MLSDAEIQDMRDTQEDNLSETVYIQTVVETSDGAGGTSESLQTTATCSGRIGPVGKDAREREIAGRLGSAHVYVITVPAETAVTPKNQLQINGRQFVIGGITRKSQASALRIVASEVL